MEIQGGKGSKKGTQFHGTVCVCLYACMYVCMYFYVYV